MNQQSNQQYGYNQPADGPPAYNIQPQQAPPYGYGPQPGPQMMSNNTVVVNSQPQASNIIIAQMIRPQNYIAMSILVCLFCNWPLGLVAIIFSVMSQSEADEGDMEGARSKGRIAMWLNIAGILVTVVVVISVTAYFVTKNNANYPYNY